MKNTIVICGDSFSIGIGCRDLNNEPYGSLLSKELNMPLVNLAKGSSTNLSIYLQAKYVVDNLTDKTEIVLVSNTSYDRVNWFPLDHKFNSKELTNTDKIAQARALLIEVILSNGYTSTAAGKLIKTTH